MKITSLESQRVKVVLDTNVLLSGVFTRGVCESILDLCRQDLRFRLFGSKYILAEFERNSRTSFHVPKDETDAALRVLQAGMELVEPENVPSDACRDVNDLPILGTAVAAGANYLVTGDKDLLVLKRYRATQIISPRAFLDQM